jgi:hypothetical protein
MQGADNFQNVILAKIIQVNGQFPTIVNQPKNR